MKILITGIHGFVGSNLVAELKKAHIIYGLDIIAPTKEGIIKTYGWNELDQIPFVDCIIHLAGKAQDTKNTSSTQSYFDINVGLTQNIFDLFLVTEDKKFIFFSSVKAVADTVEGDVLFEDASPPAPKTPYGESKLAAEQYILSKPLPPNKKVYILRPCMIHGPGNKGNLNLLYNIVRKGIPWPLGAFENKRSYCSIDNLVFIIENLIEKDIDWGIYQVADDIPLSTNDLIKLIAYSQNRKSHIWNISQKLIESIAFLGDKLRIPLNSERLNKLTDSYVVSNEKLIKAIGKSLPITSKQGLLKTFESFKKA